MMWWAKKHSKGCGCKEAKEAAKKAYVDYCKNMNIHAWYRYEDLSMEAGNMERKCVPPGNYL